MKLSIIIPVYNAETTLPQCVSSLTTQSFSDYEIIMVDDGSTDASGDLCDKFSRDDKRIVVLHTTNGGPGTARNHALEIATGEYVTFVDSDDYLPKDTLSATMEIMDSHSDYDILEFPILTSDRKGKPLTSTFGDKEYKDFPSYWLTEQGYRHAYMWNKIYRRTLFNGLRFSPDYIFEDLRIQPQLMKRARIIATTSRGGYHYSNTPTSLSHRVSGRQMRMAVETHEATLDELAGMYANEISFQKYYMHAVNAQIDLYALTREILLRQRRVSWRAMSHESIIFKLKIIIHNTLGLKSLCKIIQLLHHLPCP